MFAVFVLALALAMDAFAVSLAQGAAGRMRVGEALKLALAFGIAQAVMPLIGWGLGTAFAGWIESVDHWIAFSLLTALGLNMIRASRQDTEADPALAGWHLFAAAIATSIDAAAAGITLPLLAVPVGWACAVIGIVTAILCFGGALGGHHVGKRFEGRAEIFGGLVLIALGVKILVEHLSA
ncbi:manganese efflux pump MntP [Parasphingopyxis marina]|uniref:Putative manganese efflux pump MntP n=1 Tax=Parasphingopyxis marina TaxID=2761622 RepID=A0A842I046_9SPHN|nr:manganese efflux pump MntP family protein [Parasphingopyxis marina]MBC2777134.1 manganese efflux pump [Parasphingopyxis marina]